MILLVHKKFWDNDLVNKRSFTIIADHLMSDSQRKKLNIFVIFEIWDGLHRFWWRMLETKYVGDNFEMLVTVLADFDTNIFYILPVASGINIQKKSPISKFCHKHPKIVTNIHLSSIYVATLLFYSRFEMDENYFSVNTSLQNESQ